MTNMIEVGTQKEKQEQRLAKAIKNIRTLFGRDYEKIIESARQHDVDISLSDIRTPPHAHAYNLRIPSEKDIDAIKHSKTFKIGCMDYRVSGPSEEDTQYDLRLTMAGGSNPEHDENRAEALAEFIAAILALNPNLEITLAIHNGVCGGVNFDTKGQAKKIFEEKGPDAETTFMEQGLHEFGQRLMSMNIPMNTVHFALEMVDSDGHSFAGVREVALA